MAEGNSGGFATFLKVTADRLSPNKGVKFMPPKTKVQTGKNGNTTDSKKLSQKEHRRAQVRKAQIEHRQRKENYVKHLEQDVMNLRDMISGAETEAAAIKQENMTIKSTLSKAKIPSVFVPPTNLHLAKQDYSPASFTTGQSPMQGTVYNSPSDYQSPQYNSKWPSDASSTVSITFDELIDASCLHISPRGELDDAAVVNSPDIFNFPGNPLSQRPSDALTAFSSPNGLQKPLPHLPDEPAQTVVPFKSDLSSIAINFILALEHPCRTHFHARPVEFDPKGDPSGHELMVSTLLYSHAPDAVFSKLNSASWSAPSLELTQLWEMSQSLPKGDFEITPVQAWFLLTGNYDLRKVLGELERLKKGVGQLVGCWAFGAVMDEGRFWTVVREIMGEETVGLKRLEDSHWI